MTSGGGHRQEPPLGGDASRERTAVLVINLRVESGRLIATVTVARDMLGRTPDRRFSTMNLDEVTQEIHSVAAGLLGNHP